VAGIPRFNEVRYGVMTMAALVIVRLARDLPALSLVGSPPASCPPGKRLTAATPALLTEERGRPDEASIRRALGRWGFNTKQRSKPPGLLSLCRVFARSLCRR